MRQKIDATLRSRKKPFPVKPCGRRYGGEYAAALASLKDTDHIAPEKKGKKEPMRVGPGRPRPGRPSSWMWLVLHQCAALPLNRMREALGI